MLLFFFFFRNSILKTRENNKREQNLKVNGENNDSLCKFKSKEKDANHHIIELAILLAFFLLCFVIVFIFILFNYKIIKIKFKKINK